MLNIVNLVGRYRIIDPGKNDKAHPLKHILKQGYYDGGRVLISGAQIFIIDNILLNHNYLYSRSNSRAHSHTGIYIFQQKYSRARIVTRGKKLLSKMDRMAAQLKSTDIVVLAASSCKGLVGFCDTRGVTFGRRKDGQMISNDVKKALTLVSCGGDPGPFEFFKS